MIGSNSYEMTLGIKEFNFGFELLVVEDKGGETTQEDRDAIELMHSQACSKVAMMSTGKASGENSMKGSCVGTDSSYNCGHCARCG